MDNTALMNESNSGKGITGTTLKIIAIVAMFLDHFSAIILQNRQAQLYEEVNPQSMEEQMAWVMAHPFWTYGPGILRLIGRFGFPLFVFLLVEGFTHTRSVAKYARNLAIFAIISELPFNLGFAQKLFYPGYQNVFVTLFLGLICIWMIDKFAYNRQWSPKLAPLNYLAAILLGVGCGFFITQTEISLIISEIATRTGNDAFPNYYYYIAGAVITLIVHLIVSRKWDADKKNTYTAVVVIMLVFSVIATVLQTDYSGAGVMTITVMYLFRANKKKAFALGCVVLTVMSIVEAAAFLMLIPVSKYNGERGPKINKYLFYAFYPVHIGVLYLVGYLLGILPFAIK